MCYIAVVNTLGINILVVDDHRMVCELLADMMRHLPAVQQILTATSSAKAMEMVQKQRVDVAFVDVRMPDTAGIELIAKWRKIRPQMKLVAMTSFDEDETLIDMLQAAPDGILLKRSTGREDIHLCLNEILKGGGYYSPTIQERLMKPPTLLRPIQRLTKRELEILQLICEGHSSKLIAHRLQLKEATVDDYRKEMLKKTSTKNVAELVSYAHRNGLV